MSQNLPSFPYHPDPVATGSVVGESFRCVSCGQERTFRYVASVYSPHDLRGKLCPWCIADGRAAETLKASFNDPEPLLRAGVPTSVALEVETRTPGYSSWQQEVWLACCRDACEFHGDTSAQELEALSAAEVEGVAGEWHTTVERVRGLFSHYTPGGSPSIFKFRCRHCGRTRYALDFT